MATKEPLRRCVRCKTKKKGCSRGNPCERCALAGLTADECVYLESDATFRSIKPKKKELTSHVHKTVSTKVSKPVTFLPADPGAIVRCSRCIRTARGCSHERPCEPCREHGLSEWECRYTSASSFKVRGPGLRKVKSLERVAVEDSTSEGDEELVAKVLKQDRSYSTSSAKLPRSRLVLSEVPRDYRTPSPPTNISPISNRASSHDQEETSSPFVDTELPQPQAMPIPGNQNHIVPISKNDTTQMTRQDSTNSLPAGSVEPPPMVTLIPSISQQSHANTIPESSPAVYTDDYQSSPSPFNSPQFQSSPPIHFQPVIGTSGSTTFTNEQPMYPPQLPYRPPAGYAMQAHARQYAAAQAQHGFVPIPQNSRSQQQVMSYSQSPPYQIQHYAHQQMYSTSPGPRHRAVPTPSPRHASPGPYAIPTRHQSYQGSNPALEGRLQVFQQAHHGQQAGVPIRLKSQPHNSIYPQYGTSPTSHGDALTEFKNNLTRQSSQANSHTHEAQGEADLPEFGEWQDEIGVFGQPTPHE